MDVRQGYQISRGTCIWWTDDLGHSIVGQGELDVKAYESRLISNYSVLIDNDRMGIRLQLHHLHSV